jgi:hypothetical protein
LAWINYQYQISQEAIERLVTSPIFTSSFERVSQAHGLKFPLKFSSYLDELNVLSVLSLLNFGSGYRVPLHEATGRGAWDTMRALVLSLYLGSTTGEDLLSAKGMEKISLAMVAELLRVDVHVERPHETLPGVTVGELGGPLYELVKLITDVLNETGRLVAEYGYSNLGSFVLATLEEGKKAGDAELEVVLERVRGHSERLKLTNRWIDCACISRIPGHGDSGWTCYLLLQKGTVFDTCDTFTIWIDETNTVSGTGHETKPGVCRQCATNDVDALWSDRGGRGYRRGSKQGGGIHPASGGD